MAKTDSGSRLAEVDPFETVAQARAERGPIVASWFIVIKQ